MAKHVSRYKQEGNWSQRDQRRGQMFKDQHGRRYHATIELRTGHPVGQLEPQFRAPLMPPAKYQELDKDPERPYDVFVNYERWEQDIRTDRAEWEREGRQRSLKMYGDKYNPAEAFTSEVLDIIGPAPQAVEPVIAARQGNPWILGRSRVPDRRLIKFFQPEELDLELRRAAEPDFSKLEKLEDFNDEYDPEAEGGRRKKDARRNHHKKRDTADAGEPAGAGAS